MLALLLDLARLSGVSQLDTDSTELLTRVKLKAANSHCLGSSSICLKALALAAYSWGTFLPPKGKEALHG